MNNKEDENKRHIQSKEELESIVNACYAKGRGEKVEMPKPTNDNQLLNAQEVAKVVAPDAPKKGKKGKAKVDGIVAPTATKVSESDDTLRKFGEKCFNLEITASDCNIESKKNESNDERVVEMIRGINQKIYNEVRNGGFSVGVVFNVYQEDWINASHVLNWYKTRGFDVVDYVSGPDQYSKNGCIRHSFTLSWV